MFYIYLHLYTFRFIKSYIEHEVSDIFIIVYMNLCDDVLFLLNLDKNIGF